MDDDQTVIDPSDDLTAVDADQLSVERDLEIADNTLTAPEAATETPEDGVSDEDTDTNADEMMEALEQESTEEPDQLAA